MVRPYYVDEITAISERELRPIAETVEPPACLLGGWAVFHRVNSRFQQEYGRRFIGSRDIDIGFHVNPDWDADDLHESPVGEAVQRVQKIGYMPLSFRFVRHFERSTGEALTEDEARSLPPHQLFDLYLDLIMDTTDLDTFQEVLGFRPPAEE